MKKLCLIALTSLVACGGAPRSGDTPPAESTKRHDGKVVGTLGGAAGGAAMGYSSAGVLCTISGPLCLVVVVPAAIVGGVVGLAAGSVVDAVSAGPRPQAAPPPAGTSAPLGG